MVSEVSSDVSGNEIIRLLDLQPHPEGGWYRQTFKDTPVDQDRPNSTAIYYMLQAEERSAWHKIDAVEVWHYYAGAPLRLSISDGHSVDEHTLGADLENGQRPQVVVLRFAWQSAVSMGDFTLVGCTVAPGFEFAGFELAASDWAPGLY